MEAKGQTFPNDPPLTELPVTFRDTCREYLEKALSKGMRLLDIEDDAQSIAICAVKALEIENELFEQFQSELGTTRVSDLYRSTARRLRYNLEDQSNLTLVARVILGEIEPPALVEMSPEQLASDKAKSDRAKAEEEAKRNNLLSPGTPTKSGKVINCDKSEEDCSEHEPNNINLDAEEVSVSKKLSQVVGTESGIVTSSHDGESPEKSTSSSFATPMEVTPSPPSFDVECNKLSSDDAKMDGRERVDDTRKEELSSASIVTSIKATSKMGKSNRPPPPPSLAVSARTTPSPTMGLPAVSQTGKDRGRRILAASGGDKFRIEIMKPKVSFSVGFYIESETNNHASDSIDNYVPERLIEKGRLRIEAFQDFLNGKLLKSSGGGGMGSSKWVAIPLRLTTYSDLDAQQYKTYYKEYELNKRISMFAVGENCKIFLVTPKFHSAATMNGKISLSSKTSSYAIVLTKKIF